MRHQRTVFGIAGNQSKALGPSRRRSAARQENMSLRRIGKLCGVSASTICRYPTSVGNDVCKRVL